MRRKLYQKVMAVSLAVAMMTPNAGVSAFAADMDAGSTVSVSEAADSQESTSAESGVTNYTLEDGSIIAPASDGTGYRVTFDSDSGAEDAAASDVDDAMEADSAAEVNSTAEADSAAEADSTAELDVSELEDLTVTKADTKQNAVSFDSTQVKAEKEDDSHAVDIGDGDVTVSIIAPWGDSAIAFETADGKKFSIQGVVGTPTVDKSRSAEQQEVVKETLTDAGMNPEGKNVIPQVVERIPQTVTVTDPDGKTTTFEAERFSHDESVQVDESWYTAIRYHGKKDEVLSFTQKTLTPYVIDGMYAKETTESEDTLIDFADQIPAFIDEFSGSFDLSEDMVLYADVTKSIEGFDRSPYENQTVKDLNDDHAAFFSEMNLQKDGTPKPSISGRLKKAARVVLRAANQAVGTVHLTRGSENYYPDGRNYTRGFSVNMNNVGGVDANKIETAFCAQANNTSTRSGTYTAYEMTNDAKTILALSIPGKHFAAYGDGWFKNLEWSQRYALTHAAISIIYGGGYAYGSVNNSERAIVDNAVANARSLLNDPTVVEWLGTYAHSYRLIRGGTQDIFWAREESVVFLPYGPKIRLQKVDLKTGEPIKGQFTYKMRFRLTGTEDDDTTGTGWTFGSFDDPRMKVLSSDGNGRSDYGLKDTGFGSATLGKAYQSEIAYATAEDKIQVEIKEVTAPKGYKVADMPIKIDVPLIFCHFQPDRSYIVKGNSFMNDLEDNDEYNVFNTWWGLGNRIPGQGYVWKNDTQEFQMIPNEKTTPHSLKIVKESANPTCTDGNPNYTLDGAVFGIYKDAACTDEFAKVTTNASGVTKEIAIPDVTGDPVTYYVKELSAPKGYKLNTEVQSATFTKEDADEETKSVTFKDEPINDPAHISIQKADAKKNGALKASMAGAIFTVKYYSDIITDGNPDPAAAGKAVAKKDGNDAVWTFKTDANGRLNMTDPNTKVSGPELWLDDNKDVVFPLGTVTIQETTAPNGYLVNQSVLVTQIVEKRNAADTESSAIEKEYLIRENGDIDPNVSLVNNVYTLNENSLDLQFHKTDEDGNALGGPEFKHSYTDANGRAASETLTADDSGNFLLRGLTLGQHTIEESKPLNGYVLNKNKLVFTVNANRTVTFETAGLKDGTLTVQDETGKNVATDSDSVLIDATKVAGGTLFATMTNEGTPFYRIKVSKVTLGGSKELPGASLKIVQGDSVNGAQVAAWTSGNTAHEVVLNEGTYTLVETAAPNGFVLAKSITFTVAGDRALVKDANGAYNEAPDRTIRMEDAKVVNISKKLVNGTNELPGAALKVVTGESKTGTNTVASWTSTNSQKSLQLGVGTYTLVETAAPNGFAVAEAITFKVDESGSVSVKQANGTYAAVANSTVQMQDAKIIKISKTTVNGTNELPGAALKIVNGETANGSTVTNWTSTKEQKQVQLGAGTYTLVETTAPNGFAVAESITFKIDATGKLTVKQANGTYADAANNTVHMQDARIVKISKTAVNGTTELPGAALKVVAGESKNGSNTVASWTSTNSQKELKLGTGTYTLVETQAPNGFAVAESITFRIDGDGKLTIQQANGTYADAANNTVHMQDAKIVKISKTIVNGSGELEGASLKVVKGESKDGKDVVASWTSTKQQKEIQLGVGSYTLVETTAPNGFAKTEAITFKVDAAGKLTIKQANGTYADAANNTVHMQDARIVKISKTVVNGTTELEGASLKVVKGESKDGKDVVATWTSTKQQKELNLGAGVYTLVETQAPNGFTVAESITFTVGNDGKIMIRQANGNYTDAQNSTIQMQDAKIVKISKTAINKTEELPGAALKVVRGESKDGKDVIATWTSTKDQKEIQLGVGTYTLVETTSPFGYDIAESISFKVTEDGKLMVKQADGSYKEEQNVHMQDRYTLYSLNILKTNQYGETKVLEGAEFTLFRDAACTQVVTRGTTDQTGHLVFGQLEQNTTYYMKETKAPEGYMIPKLQNGDEIVYTLTVDLDPNHGYRYSVTLPQEATGEKPMTIGAKKTITVYSDGSATSDLMSTSVNAQNELTVSLHVINPTTAKLPVTGSSMMLLLMGLGIALMGIAVLTGKKKKASH